MSSVFGSGFGQLLEAPPNRSDLSRSAFGEIARTLMDFSSSRLSTKRPGDSCPQSAAWRQAGKFFKAYGRLLK
jgi:hypothetical protein